MLLGTEDKLTGLVIIRIIAFGQYLPQAWTRSRTIEAFVLNRSSRVIPVNSNIKMTKLQKSFFVIKHKLCSYVHYMSITMDNIVRPSGRGTVHSRPHKIFLHFHDLSTLLNNIREGVALSPLSILHKTH